MQKQIDHYLQSRPVKGSAAQRDVGGSTARRPKRTLARMLRVMAKLNPAIDSRRIFPSRNSS